MDANFQSVVVKVPGRTLRMRTIGAGRPVIHLHGTGTFPGFEFARELARSRQVVIPFFPGFGGSDEDTLGEMEDYISFVETLLNHLNVERADLSGFSLGGWVAAEFAARHPERVNRLVLAAPAGLVVDEAPAPDLREVRPEELPAYLAHDAELVLRYLPAEPDSKFERTLAKEQEGFAKLIIANPQGNPALRQSLTRITAPTLLLWGARDRIRPTAQSRAWASSLPCCQVELLPETGHLLFEESTSAALLAAAFFNQSDPPATTKSEEPR